MIKYIYWENGDPETYTIPELRVIFKNDIDKTEYKTCWIWLDDMIKMGILIEEK